MNLAQAAELILLFRLNDQVSSGLKTMQGELAKTEASTASVDSAFTKIGLGLKTGFLNAAKIGIAGVGALTTQVMAGIDSLSELEEVTNQTNAVIESTGGVAGITAEEVRSLAEEYENLTGVDDKTIQSGENLLLTFTKIGEDAFEPALAAALDLSAGLGQDLNSSITMIGKALNDPIAGLTALGRAGVQFTEEQKELIRTLVETGDAAGAQAIILEELNTQFGGSAQADMAGYRGSVTRLKDAWEDVQMTLAEGVAPALKNIVDRLNEFVRSDRFMNEVEKLGDAIAQLFSNENIDKGFGALEEAFTFLRDLPWNAIKDGMALTAEAAKKAVDVFRSLPPGVQAGLITFLAANKLTGGLVTSGLTELAKVALSSLKTITAANVTVVGPVTGPGGAPTPGAPGGGVGVAPIIVGAFGALAFDQLAGAQAAAIRGVPLTTDAAQVLVSSGYANILAQSNDPLAQTLGGILGPGFTGMLQELGFVGDTALSIANNTNGMAPGILHLPTIAEMTANSAAYLRTTAGMLPDIGRGIGMAANNAAEINQDTNNLGPMRDQLGNITGELNQQENATKELGRITAQGLAKNERNLETATKELREGNGLSNRQMERLQRLTTLQSSGNELNSRQVARLERLQGIANSSDSKLASISASSKKTSNKDFRVDVSVRTQLNVSAREVASVIRRWTDLRGENEFG